MSNNNQELVGVNYSGVISDLESVINDVNGTTSITSGIRHTPEKGDIEFFTSVNNSNSYLYNINANLFNQMSLGAENVKMILNNCAQNDSNLATVAESLNSLYDACTVGGPASAQIGGKGIPSFNTMIKNGPNIFSEKVSEREFGKVSTEKLSSSIRVSTLALNDEIRDANKLDNSITNLINSSNVRGPGWLEFRHILKNYKYCNQVRKEAASALKQAYADAEKLIKKYMDPDEELDSADIVKHEETIKKCNETIADARSSIAGLRAMMKETVSVPQLTIERGWPKLIWVSIPKYDNAVLQQRIDALIEVIKIQQVIRDEAQEALDKLLGFPAVLNAAGKIINDALTQIENTYAKNVYDVNTPRLAALGAGAPLLIKPYKSEPFPLEYEIGHEFVDENGKKVATLTESTPIIDSDGETIGRYYELRFYSDISGKKCNIHFTALSKDDVEKVMDFENKSGGELTSQTEKDVEAKYGKDAVAITNAGIDKTVYIQGGKLYKIAEEAHASPAVAISAIDKNGDMKSIYHDDPLITSLDKNGKRVLDKDKIQAWVEKEGIVAGATTFTPLIMGGEAVTDQSRFVGNAQVLNPRTLEGQTEYKDYLSIVVDGKKKEYGFILNKVDKNGEFKSDALTLASSVLEPLMDQKIETLNNNDGGGSSVMYVDLDGDGKMEAVDGVYATSGEYKAIGGERLTWSHTVYLKK